MKIATDIKGKNWVVEKERSELAELTEYSLIPTEGNNTNNFFTVDVFDYDESTRVYNAMASKFTNGAKRKELLALVESVYPGFDL